MYGWMARHLLSEGSAGPIPEGDVETLAQDDPRLRCDPDGSLMARSKTVVQLAHEKAARIVTNLQTDERMIRAWVQEFTAPPDPEPHQLLPMSLDKSELSWGLLEKIYFVSEIGQHIPGLLWRPKNKPKGTLIVVDDRGKSAVANQACHSRWSKQAMPSCRWISVGAARRSAAWTAATTTTISCSTQSCGAFLWQAGGPST